MIIGITGSRSITDQDYIIKCLDEVIKKYEPNITWVVGGARGVDMIAENYLRKMAYDVVVIKPAHSYEPQINYTPLLYKARNTAIVENSKIVVAIWDGVSGGTKMTVNLANARGRHVIKFIK